MENRGKYSDKDGLSKGNSKKRNIIILIAILILTVLVNAVKDDRNDEVRNEDKKGRELSEQIKNMKLKTYESEVVDNIKYGEIHGGFNVPEDLHLYYTTMMKDGEVHTIIDTKNKRTTQIHKNSLGIHDDFVVSEREYYEGEEKDERLLAEGEEVMRYHVKKDSGEISKEYSIEKHRIGTVLVDDGKVYVELTKVTEEVGGFFGKYYLMWLGIKSVDGNRYQIGIEDMYVDGRKYNEDADVGTTEPELIEWYVEISQKDDWEDNKLPKFEESIRFNLVVRSEEGRIDDNPDYILGTYPVNINLK